MNLASITIAQALSYALMLTLFARALGHQFAARAIGRRLRPLAAQLDNLVVDLSRGRDPDFVLAEAQATASAAGLPGLFRKSRRLLLSGGIRNQVDELLGQQCGQLNETSLANEAAGPKFGLVLTALVIFVKFSGGPNTEFSNVGVALVTTGLGMMVAIVEGMTLQTILHPLMDRLRNAATEVLVAATWPEDVGIPAPSVWQTNHILGGQTYERHAG